VYTHNDEEYKKCVDELEKIRGVADLRA
jgi:hypothetical protein